MEKRKKRIDIDTDIIYKDILEFIPTEDCLYQAYGDSPIYGRDVL